MSRNWILCKEQLPSEYSTFLITYRDMYENEVATADYCGIEDGKPVWQTQFEGMTFDDGEVIAWMPLPLPYELRSEDGER